MLTVIVHPKEQGHDGRTLSFSSEVIVVGRGDDGEMRLEKRPIQPMTDELRAVIEEMK